MDSGLYCFFSSADATDSAMAKTSHATNMCSKIGHLASFDSQHVFDYLKSSLPFVDDWTCGGTDPERVILGSYWDKCLGNKNTLLSYFWTSGSDLSFEGNFTWNSGGDPYPISQGYIFKITSNP